MLRRTSEMEIHYKAVLEDLIRQRDETDLLIKAIEFYRDYKLKEEAEALSKAAFNHPTRPGGEG